MRPMVLKGLASIASGSGQARDIMESFRFSLGLAFVLVAAPAVVVLVLGLIRGRLKPIQGLAAIVVFPVAAFAVGNLILMERAQDVRFCASCHVMVPVVESAREGRDSLAALHFEGAFPVETGCYECHSGYGIWGTLDAKVAGVKHMWVTLTGTVEYPIEIYGEYDHQACLVCHGSASDFVDAAIHRTEDVAAALDAGQMSCAGTCHPVAHPASALSAPSEEPPAPSEEERGDEEEHDDDEEETDEDHDRPGGGEHEDHGGEDE